MTHRIFRHISRFILLAVLMLAAACAPAPSATPIATLAPTEIAALTATPLPTATQLPTLTPPPTSTTQPTSAPIKTNTPTATATRTSTATLTKTPTGTATATATRRPTIAGLQSVTYPDKQLLSAAIQLYGKTMGLDANTVAAEISYQQFKDKNGSPFVAAVTLDGTPLLIYDAEKGWREATRSELGTKKGMLIGIQASGWKALQDKRYQAALISDANHLQLDDMCLWSVFEPTQGKINYTEWNKYLFSITLAREKQKTLSAGCGLIWGYPDYIPTWLKNSGYSQEQLLSIDEEHIEKFLTPVKNDVKRITVVNEVLPHLLGIPNFWIDTNHIQTDVLLQRSFRKARQIAPNAELSLREYSVEFAGYPRADEFFDLIKLLNEEERATNGRNLIDAAELQLPLFNPALIGKDPAMNPNNFVDAKARSQMMEKLRMNIRRFKAIGVKVYITELLLPIENLPGTLKQKMDLQASIYADIYRVCAEEGVGVGLWRPSQSHDIMEYPQGSTLPYPRDENYNPLPSYYAINAAILSTMK